MSNMNKFCKTCQTEKSISEFYRSAKAPDGFRWSCKQCDVKTAKAWNFDNKARHNFNRRECRKRDGSVERARDRKRQPAKTVYMREYKKRNPAFRIGHVLRTRITDALRRQYGKAGTLRELLGCPLADFKVYLESQFEPGMSWDNYGSVWEIDHIMPCSIFSMEKPEHQRRCFHFSNQRPLWKKENQRKSNKVITNQYRLI